MRALDLSTITSTESTLKRGILMARIKGGAFHLRAIFIFYLQRMNIFQQTQMHSEKDGFYADLTGAELIDQQGASLRVFPAVEAVQLCGHLVQLFISVVELGQELRVRPLHRNTSRHDIDIFNAGTIL